MQRCFPLLLDWLRSFPLTLLLAGFSAFEVLSYRWGVATIAFDSVRMVFGM